MPVSKLLPNLCYNNLNRLRGAKKMKISPMLLSDIEQVVELENKTWSEQNTPVPLPVASKDQIIQKFESNTHFLVAKIKDKIVGVLDYSPLYPFPSGQHIVTFGIAVAEKEHRKGIGRALVQIFLNEVKNDYQKVLIHVLSSNQEAVLFYKKLGFNLEACLTKQFFLKGQYVDDLIYSYDLEAAYAK
jgi:putative acetyltransferase